MTNDFLYDFNVIYHRKSNDESDNDNHDSELALSFTKFLVQKLSEFGFRKGYYSDRDATGGTNIFEELCRVVDLSWITIVVLTPGLQKSSWNEYCRQTCFKKLLDKNQSYRFIPLSLGVKKESLPEELNLQEVIYFNKDHFKDDDSSQCWSRLKQVSKMNLYFSFNYLAYNILLVRPELPKYHKTLFKICPCVYKTAQCSSTLL